MLTISPGMKNGETRLGPFSSRILCVASISGRPPIPEPMTTPTRSAFSSSIRSPESSSAKRAAASAKWMKVSLFLTSFLST